MLPVTDNGFENERKAIPVTREDSALSVSEPSSGSYYSESEESSTEEIEDSDIPVQRNRPIRQRQTRQFPDAIPWDALRIR